MAKKEDELAKYAMETEGQDSIQNPEPKEPTSLSSINMGAVGRPEATEKLRQEAAEKIKQLNEKSVEENQFQGLIDTDDLENKIEELQKVIASTEEEIKRLKEAKDDIITAEKPAE